MTAHEIIAELARKKVVEQIVDKVAVRYQYHNRQDLSQRIYEALLTYQPEIIERAWEEDHEQMKFIVARIAKNQVWQHNTQWQRECLWFDERRSELKDYPDDKG